MYLIIINTYIILNTKGKKSYIGQKDSIYQVNAQKFEHGLCITS